MADVTIRKQLTAALKEAASVAKAERVALESKQLVEEGSFTVDWMNKNEILRPPYDPSKLFFIVENSSILPQCIDAMLLNTDGFGIQFFYTGDIEDEKSDEVIGERKMLEAFFKKVNEKESFTTVRKNMRRDLESTGNGYIEIIRTLGSKEKGGNIGLMYHADCKHIRLQKKQKEPVNIQVKVVRRGKLAKVTVGKRFRKFVMITSTAMKRYRWFKEYGDPREMNADSGKYKGEAGYKAGNPATELLHFKIGNAPYGIPRWSGNVANAMGMHSADFVNFDLFENQVVPPLAIMVSGGKLTNEAVEDVKSILIEKRGVENFNKVLVLEAQSDGDIGDKSAIKIDIKELSFARKEDAMFTTYVDKGEHRIRGSFRLPPLYLGRADTYSKSTADSSKMVAEEQVFVPERQTFDEVMDNTIMEELNVKYHSFRSKGPRLVSGEQIIEGFKEFGKLGVFTINEGIRVANRTLGLDITTYEKEWAEYPIAIVLELVKLGMLKDIEEISDASGVVADVMGDINNPEDLAKAYKAFRSLHTKLKEMSETRSKEEDDSSSGKAPSPFTIESTAEVN
jgi:PBSX family phage portal protein